MPLTTIAATAAAPTIPPSAMTVDVVFACVPNPTPRTCNEKVQELPAVSVAPVKLIKLEPAAAVIVPAPQEPVRPFGVFTTNPTGSGSVKEIPVRGITFAAGLVTVKLRAVLSDPVK